MKFSKLILFLVATNLFIYKSAKAQTEINAGSQNYSEVFDSLSTGLITSRILYGVLYDRTAGWSGLVEWQNNDTTTATQVIESWYDGEQSFINPLVRTNRYLSLRNNLNVKLATSAFPIIISCNRFGYFDSLAVNDGRMTINNGMLIDI